MMKRNFPASFGRDEEFQKVMQRLAKEEIERKQPAQRLPNPKTFTPGIPKVNANNYIRVPIEGIYGSPVYISLCELKDSQNMTYNNTHKFLFDTGNYMPTPSIFMAHFKNVIAAKEGREELFYADGRKVGDDVLEDLYLRLTGEKLDVSLINGRGAWTWLNAEFGNNKIITVLRKLPSGILIKKESELEQCLQADTYVNFDSTSQGLPKISSFCRGQEYPMPGKNIRYWYPHPGSAAKFCVGSSKAHLDCNWNPTKSIFEMGSFGCYERGEKK